jgi:trimeric autotransporter adhesin
MPLYRGRRTRELSNLIQPRSTRSSPHSLWAILAAAILCFCAGRNPAIAQAISRVASINTVAGNGIAGYSGDNGPAGSAELNSPSGVAIDKAGNLYIADAANNVIRKVAPSTGIISTIAGNGTAGYIGNGGPATSAELHSPVGVALDGAGDVYVADQGNSVIREVSASGTITTVVGNNAVGYSGDGGSATNATLYAPAGVAVDSSGNIYIADTGNNRVRMVNATGIITTIVGNGTAGYSGDSGPATSATLNKPSALAEGSGGNLYVADTGNNVIREVNATGTITTVAGNGTAGYSGDGGPAVSATLNSPYGLAIDGSGNLYIADSNNNVVRLVTAAGIMTTVVGNGTPGFGGDGGPATSAILNGPHGVALDGPGNFYISDEGNNRVRQVTTPAGSVFFPTTPVTSTSAAVAIPLEVNTPGTTITGISVPVSQGGKQEYTVTAPGCALNTALAEGTFCNVMVTFSPGYPGPRPIPLQVASSAGTFNFGMVGIGTAPQVALSPGITSIVATQNTGTDTVVLSGGIAIDGVGNLYAVQTEDDASNSIIEYAVGTGLPTVVLLPTDLTDFDYPGTLHLGVDSTGNLYIANPTSPCVLKVAPGSGVATVVAGVLNADSNECEGGYSGDNGPATNALLGSPGSVAVDSAGNIYVSDSSRIRKITVASGIITTVAGNGTAGYSGDNGPATEAELSPGQIAVDSAGNLYFTDDYSNRVRKVTAASGIITTVAGNGTAGYSGDNGPATEAELNEPTAIAVDSAGDIYVQDAVNNVVRMVNTAGIITSVPGTSVTIPPDEPPGILDIIRTYIVFAGVAVDGAGNLYIDNPALGGVRMVNVSESVLNFPSAQIGATSMQTVTVTNTGNAPLAFPLPPSGQNPSFSAGFSLDSSSSCPKPSAGSQPSTLASGNSCSFVVDFAQPAMNGVSGTADITDNSLNTNLVQTVQLNGGTGETFGTTTTVNVTTPIYGQTQVSATILATGGTLVPAGSVVFTVDGAAQPAVPVNASGVATLSSAISNPLAVGSHTIGAAYTSSFLGFTNSVATRIFSVSQIPPSVTIAPGDSSLTVSPGGSVTDTLIFTSVGGFTGTLQFSCTNLPKNATCSFLPSTLALSSTSGSQTTVLTIQTSGSAAELRSKPFTPGAGPIESAAAFWTPGLLLLALSRRKRRTSRQYYVIVLLALLVGAGVMIGCGGGGSTPAATTQTAPVTPPLIPATPAGTTTVQITAMASGTAVQSLSLTLTVQ